MIALAGRTPAHGADETPAIYIHLIEGAQDSAVAELEGFDHAATAAAGQEAAS